MVEITHISIIYKDCRFEIFRMHVGIVKEHKEWYYSQCWVKVSVVTSASKQYINIDEEEGSGHTRTLLWKIDSIFPASYFKGLGMQIILFHCKCYAH